MWTIEDWIELSSIEKFVASSFLMGIEFMGNTPFVKK